MPYNQFMDSNKLAQFIVNYLSRHQGKNFNEDTLEEIAYDINFLLKEMHPIWHKSVYVEPFLEDHKIKFQVHNIQ